MKKKNATTFGRWASLIGGGALLTYGAVLLARRAKAQGTDLTGSLLEKGGKVFRGKWRLPEGARLVEPGERDVVEQASYESFPASDPPSFTPAKVG
jgi:hypothetical protein